MERPDIIGWEITTNENGIKMATLPQSKMIEILEYMKYAESELKKLRVSDVSGRSEQLKCDICDSTDICSHSEGFICNDCNNVMTAF